MQSRIIEIIKLIQEEAKERAGLKDYVSKLYDVTLDVQLAVGQLMKLLKEQETEDAKKEGGGEWRVI